jgi:iron-sulfur cluster assembly protein
MHTPAPTEVEDAPGIPIGELGLTISPRALEMGRVKLAEDGGHRAIRIGVKGGGCSGLTYVFEFADDEVREGKEHRWEHEGLTLYINKRSLKFLAGSELRWNDGLVGYGFRWENPNAKKDCGCGVSFQV